MKKILAVLLSAALVLSLTACSGNSETDSPRNSGSDKNSSDNSGGGQSSTPVIPSVKLGIWDVLPEIPVTDVSAFEYKYNSKLEGMEITDYLRESPKVRIPDSIEGEKVVSVDLSGCKKELTQLVMPDSVKGFKLSDTIYKTLQYVNVPKGVDTVGRFGSNLTAVYISDGVVKIGKDAFRDCKNLANIYIPDSVTEIGENAFYDCESLASVNIPSSVTIIGDTAFCACKSLTSIVIPNGVTRIGNVFVSCTSLKSVVLPDSVTSINDYYAFNGCESLTNVTYKGKTYDYEHISSLYNAINLGESGMLIEDGVLKKVNPESTSITIPNNVAEISRYAFSDCTSLTSVTIPDIVTVIGEGAFSSCTSLTNVTYKGKVYNSDSIDNLYDDINMGETGLLIEDGVLKDVSGALTEVVIPDDVTEIGGGAFRNCARLTNLIIPNNVNKIGERAFNGCTGLTRITIPNSVTEIDIYAFSNCTSLASITIPNSVTDIHQGCFENCTSLSSVTIPNGVTEIGYEAFKDCTSLTSVAIPNNVTKIDSSAFKNCTSLTSVAIPDSMTDIGAEAFSGCTSLTNINIPNGCSLDYNAFDGCENLTNITGDSIYYISNGLLCYKSMLNGRTCIVRCLKKNAANITFPDDVIEICDYAFSGCAITHVNISIKPDVQFYIRNNAFQDCKNLVSVTLSSNTSIDKNRDYALVNICDYIFSGCENLTSVTIPQYYSLNESKNSFEGCPKLNNIRDSGNNIIRQIQ